MPANNGFGLHDEQCAPPARPDEGQDDSEESVGLREPRSGVLRLAYGYLMPKAEILGNQTGPAPEQAEQGRDQRLAELSHYADATGLAG